MKILLINCNLAFPEHEVRHLRFTAGSIVSILPFLEKNHEGGPFRPDVLIQKELLGARTFIKDLDQFDCLKIYWSIDSHLNLYWQRWYGKLFDLILTPHASLFSSLPKSWQIPKVYPFPEPGVSLAWCPHAQRQHALSFVGVVDDNRPQRKNFVQFLQQHDVHFCNRIPYHEMMNLYADTRILPNESIGGEFNFRIMEGASAGCCVITEDIGEDLAQNFDIGKEVVTYRNPLELHDLLKFFANRPALTEKMGMAARRRVQTQHLPQHRSSRLLKIIADNAAHRCRQPNRIDFAIACVQWARGAAVPLDKFSQFVSDFSKIDTTLGLSFKLKVLVEVGDANNSKALAMSILGRLSGAIQGEEADFDILTSCAVAAIKLSDFPLLLKCWQKLDPVFCGEDAPHSLFDGCLRWARLLTVSGRLCQPGFQFSVDRHCPETAFEMLLLAQMHASSQESVRAFTREMASMGDKVPHRLFALKYKAQYSLDNPDDWKASFNYALASMQSFCLTEGLSEFRLSYEMACRQKQAEEFRQLASNMGILKYLL